MSPFGNKIPSLLSTDRIANMIKYSHIAKRGGYFAEFGMYQGGSLEILARFNPSIEIIAVDSFEGLPKESEHDFHRLGDFGGLDFYAIAGYFKMMYPNVRIIKGFIPKAFDFFDEATKFSFTHVDLDLYESIKASIDFLLPRTIEGGIILIDDYKVNSTPGCEKAINEFFEEHTEAVVYFRGELSYWGDSDNAKSNNQYLIVK